MQLTMRSDKNAAQRSLRWRLRITTFISDIFYDLANLFNELVVMLQKSFAE